MRGGYVQVSIAQSHAVPSGAIRCFLQRPTLVRQRGAGCHERDDPRKR